MRIVALATGVGNVRSVLRALERATSGVRTKQITATAEPNAVRGADVLVVPGQGSFGAFAAALDQGLRDTVLEHIRSGKPYFGICLGLQILFEESDEAPGAKGLGVLAGRVRRLVPGIDASVGRTRPLPHVGWNRADAATSRATLVEPAFYYFAHSYVAAPTDAAVTLTTTSYGDDTFTSSVGKDNITGVQFHPEKSQRAGLSLLERFFAQVSSELSPQAGR